LFLKENLKTNEVEQIGKNYLVRRFKMGDFFRKLIRKIVVEFTR
jgi:hypothetical protein